MRYVKFDSKVNPLGSKRYKRGKAPKYTPRVRQQRIKYVKVSPVGRAAQKSKGVWDREKKKWAFLDHMPLEEIGVANASAFVWMPPMEKKEDGIEPLESKKYPRKLQVLTCFSWHTRHAFVHADLQRRKTLTMNRDYKICKRNVNGGEYERAIHWLGPILQEKGVKHLIVDNDAKLHSKMAHDAWLEYGIEVYPSGGKNAWDSQEGGFPVNCPDCMPNDQQLHNEFKNHEGMFFDMWNSTKPSRRKNGRFMNLIQKTMEKLPQSSVRRAIDTQRSVCLEILKNGGKATKYMYNSCARS